MSESDELQSINARIDAVCDEFERRFGGDQHRPIEDILLANSDLRTSALMRELLDVEIALRRQRGDVISQDEYLQRFPQDSKVVLAAFKDSHVDPEATQLQPQADAAANDASYAANDSLTASGGTYRERRQVLR